MCGQRQGCGYRVCAVQKLQHEWCRCRCRRVSNATLVRINKALCVCDTSGLTSQLTRRLRCTAHGGDVSIDQHATTQTAKADGHSTPTTHPSFHHDHHRTRPPRLTFAFLPVGGATGAGGLLLAVLLPLMLLRTGGCSCERASLLLGLQAGRYDARRARLSCVWCI